MGKGDRRAHNRKPGKRTPSGRLSRAGDAVAEREHDEERVAFEQGPMQTVLQARRRQLIPFPESPAEVPRWLRKVSGPVSKAQVEALGLKYSGTPLGDWLACGRLTAEQVNAADTYAEVVHRFRVAKGFPPQDPQGARYGEVMGGGGEPSPEAIEAATRAYRAAQGAIDAKGVAVALAMTRACVRLRHAPLHLVQVGIRALMERG